MPIFSYLVTDHTGKKVRGQVEAKDRASVISSLRKSQLIIIQIQEISAKGAQGSFFAKVKLDDLIIFTRQLSALIKAGVPLVRGLNILFSQVESNRLKEIIASMITKIEAGSSLSDAMSSYPAVFNALYVNMIRSGEVSGALENILDRLSTYIENTSKLTKKVRAALIYPAVVFSVAILITSLIIIFVIPQFKEMFAGLGGTLPLPTRILIGISDIFSKYLLYAIGLLLILVVGGFQLMKIPKFILMKDKMSINFPVFGKLIKKVIIARFSRTLSTLLKSGVTILSALEIASRTSGNMVVESMLNKLAVRVSKGERIGESLGENKIFPPLVVNLISVGEEVGDIATMLDKIATFYEDEVEMAVNNMTSLIEPFIIVFLGTVIGTIVVSLFLPILKLTQMVGAQ